MPGPYAVTKPWVPSVNVTPFLHWPVAMPVAGSDGQVVPPSVVCEIAIDWLWHCVPGEPVCASQPSWSSMKEISGLTGSAGERPLLPGVAAIGAAKEPRAGDQRPAHGA